jgi:hypothetical protein
MGASVPVSQSRKGGKPNHLLMELDQNGSCLVLLSLERVFNWCSRALSLLSLRWQTVHLLRFGYGEMVGRVLTTVWFYLFGQVRIADHNGQAGIELKKK